MKKHIAQLSVIVLESNNHLATQQTKNGTIELKIFSQGLAENQLQMKYILLSIKHMVNS